MKKIIHLLNLLLFITISSCVQNSENCKEIPNNFSNYNQAKELILNSKFKFSEKADVSNSSWISSAKYLSCDEESGFFIITTNNRTYIHQNLPIGVWEQFKNADSKGSYYSRNIKGNYSLKLN